jgi:hypothetical protein
MAQTDPGRVLSLSLSSQKAGQKQKGQILAVSAQLMALVSALGSLSSVALRIASARVLISLPPLSPFPSARGHFYFAEQGTFLLCIDITIVDDAFHPTCNNRDCNGTS